MYLRPLVALLILGYCSAALYGRAHVISITRDSSHVQVASHDGRQLDIVTSVLGRLSGRNDLEVVLTGPNIPTRAVRNYDQRGKYFSFPLKKQTFHSTHLPSNKLASSVLPV